MPAKKPTRTVTHIQAGVLCGKGRLCTLARVPNGLARKVARKGAATCSKTFKEEVTFLEIASTSAVCHALIAAELASRAWGKHATHATGGEGSCIRGRDEARGPWASHGEQPAHATSLPSQE